MNYVVGDVPFVVKRHPLLVFVSTTYITDTIKVSFGKLLLYGSDLVEFVYHKKSMVIWYMKLKLVVVLFFLLF